ncbi:MAG: shikimate dehydrogenase [Acidimicrobiales bacterium]
MTLSGRSQVAGVIGSPVAHSRSPAILNAAFASAALDWIYVAFEVAPQRLRAALDGARALGVRGLSVTMPHKDAVATLVDRASDDAVMLGAVNCVVNDGAALVGHNTDGPGFIDALVADAGFLAEGRRVVLVGAGGAARAIALALGRAGAADVAVLNRTQSRAQAAAALAGRAGRIAVPDDISSADLVVNATPIGMLDGALPLDAGLLRAGQVVADVVYHPTTTPLLAAAAECGATPVNGLGMLVHQAAHAFELWTGVQAPIEAMLRAASGEDTTPGP